jgi:GNAT superfamily N-acetyltransferase
MVIEIRRVTADDAGELAELLKQIEWFDAFAHESMEVLIERVRRQIELCGADESHSSYCATSSTGEILGYVSAHWLPYLFMRGPEGYISELFVRAGARGRGIGGQLLKIVEREAKERDSQRLSLINLRGRESYQRQFYVKAGWQERSEAANFILPIL